LASELLFSLRKSKFSISTNLYLRGEKTAQALEANLTSLEKKIDDLLASFEESERLQVEAKSSNVKGPEPSSGEGASKESKQP